MGPPCLSETGSPVQEILRRPLLECATASATHAPAGKTAAIAPGAVTAAARGHEGPLGAGRKSAETLVEASEVEAAAGRVPRGLAHGQPIEAVYPALAHAERNRPGEPLVHGVGWQPAQLVLARPLEKLPEAAHPGHRLCTPPGPARHEGRESEHDEAGGAEADSKR